MSRRLEIELTSRAPDGSWTWRAAGAREPRGTLSADFVPGDAKVGAVLRAEVESGLEGLEVLSVTQTKPERSRTAPPSRIEVLGTGQRGPDVSVTYAPGSKRRDEDRPRRGGRDGDRRGPRDGAERPERRERSERTERAPGGRPAGRGPRREGATPGEGTEGRDQRRGRSGPTERRERRPAVSTAHRNAALADLRPEQLAVAEQLVRGGIPAVRQAIAEQNTKAKAEGKPPVASDAILKIAEELLPVVRLADWKDRATAAQLAGKDGRLRELRAIVTAARTISLDEEAKLLSKALQDSLDQRVTGLRDEWVNRINNAITEGRVLDALKISARAPEPGTRCPADLAVAMTAAASAAMTKQTEPDAWVALLDAVVNSPVRRTVKPEGIPAGEAVHTAALHAAGLVPEIAKLLGLRIPPPPPRRPLGASPLSATGGGARSSAP